MLCIMIYFRMFQHDFSPVCILPSAHLLFLMLQKVCLNEIHVEYIQTCLYNGVV